MLKRITLHLARSPDHPEGSSRHGYEIVAPLTGEGMLDEAAWREQARLCRVRRFWAGEPDQAGWLARRPGGAGGAHWAVDYDAASSDDDEPLFRLESHRLAPGDYVSIRDADEELHTFKVADVRAA